MERWRDGAMLQLWRTAKRTCTDHFSLCRPVMILLTIEIPNVVGGSSDRTRNSFNDDYLITLTMCVNNKLLLHCNKKSICCYQHTTFASSNAL